MDARHPDGYEAMFAAFSLISLHDLQQHSPVKGKQGSAGASGSSDREGRKGGPSHHLRHTWVQQPELGAQVLDVAALQAAWADMLEQGG